MPRIAIIFFVFIWAVTAQAENRTEIHLFKYGRTNTVSLQTAFNDFRDMLAEKLPKLASEMLNIKVEVPAVSHLQLKSVLDENGQLLRPEERIGSLNA